MTDERGRRLGMASIKAAHLPDGATAFWGTGTDQRALATRWTQGMAPWRGAIPVVGTKHAAIELELSMAPWQYSLDVVTPQTFRSSIRSTVAVQVRRCCWAAPRTLAIGFTIHLFLHLFHPSSKQTFCF